MRKLQRMSMSYTLQFNHDNKTLNFEEILFSKPSERDCMGAIYQTQVKRVGARVYFCNKELKNYYLDLDLNVTRSVIVK